MLILDEPTNHLDVDAREALVQALNEYTGAVVIVSHDRHMIETTADRLVLVADGTAREYDGTLDDYVALVLAKDPGAKADKANRKHERRAAAEAREKSQGLRKQVREAEAALAKLGEQRSAIDRAMFDPSGAEAALAKLTMGELMRRRAEVQTQFEASEATWVAASEALEGVEA